MEKKNKAANTMKRTITIVAFAFTLSTITSLVAFVGQGKQGANGPRDCASCHYGPTLSDTMPGATYFQIAHRTDCAPLSYGPGENEYAFEIALASGNTAMGWDPDTLMNVLGIALVIRDTIGQQTGIVRECECETGGTWYRSGSYAETASEVPARHYRTRYGWAAPYTGNGSRCRITFEPDNTYRGDVVLEFRAVLSDSSDAYPIDWMVFATDTIPFSVSASIAPRVSPLHSRRTFDVLGRDGGRMYVEDGKLKVRVE
jgi:hypothetical protein